MIGAWIRGSRKTLKPISAMPVDQRLAVRRVTREARRLPALRRRTDRARHRARRRRASAACSATASSSPCTSTGRAGRARATSSCRRTARARSCARTRSPCPADPRCTCPTRRSSASNGVVAASIGDRAERAHGVDDEAACRAVATTSAISGSGLRMPVDVSQWISADVRDRRIGVEHARDVGGGGRHVVRGLERRQLAAHHFGELRQALAVGAVDQHQHVAVARHQRVDRSLDRERAAALQRNADVRRARR